MSTKEVVIDNLRVGYCTSAKISAETQTESTPTFDGPVTDGTDQVPHTVEIERLRYSKITDYVELSKLLHEMLTTAKNITIRETIKMADGEAKITDAVFNCVLDSDEYELDPEEQTVESLKFTGGIRHRWINGEKIY